MERFSIIEKGKRDWSKGKVFLIRDNRENQVVAMSDDKEEILNWFGDFLSNFD